MEIDKAIFNRNLLLTQVYCALQLQKPFTNNAEVLRSINLEYNESKLFTYEKRQHEKLSWIETIWSIDPIMGQDKDFYKELFDKQLHHKNEVTHELTPIKIYNGQILVAEIDMTMLDGASEAVSGGFIDINDCPPIDTWFYMSKDKDDYRIIYAWIPERFIESANEAIEVNCVDCLYWE